MREEGAYMDQGRRCYGTGSGPLPWRFNAKCAVGFPRMKVLSIEVNACRRDCLLNQVSELGVMAFRSSLEAGETSRDVGSKRFSARGKKEVRRSLLTSVCLGHTEIDRSA